jgi:hypothetical protein
MSRFVLRCGTNCIGAWTEEYCLFIRCIGHSGYDRGEREGGGRGRIEGEQYVGGGG